LHFCIINGFLCLMYFVGHYLHDPLWLDLVSRDYCSLLIDPIRILAVLPTPQPPPNGCCCCYQAKVRVELKGILRVMSLSASFSLGIQIRLKGLEMVMPLPAPSNLVLKPLYTAIFLAFAQDLEDRVIYGPFVIIYGPISHC